MKKITDLQYQYLQKICFLLFLQLLLLLFIVWFIHRFFPKIICLLTCQKWLDLLSFLLIMMLLIYTSHHSDYSLSIRYIAFFLMSAILAYVLALQYNIISMLNRNDQQTATTFIKAVVIVVTILVINLLLLPFTLRYMGFVYAMSSALFICLIGLIVWGLLIGGHFLLWVSMSLFIFVAFLLTDLNILVSQCRNKKTCDALNGASLLYVDLINILQNLFVLMNQHNR